MDTQHIRAARQTPKKPRTVLDNADTKLSQQEGNAPKVIQTTAILESKLTVGCSLGRASQPFLPNFPFALAPQAAESNMSRIAGNLVCRTHDRRHCRKTASREAGYEVGPSYRLRIRALGAGQSPVPVTSSHAVHAKYCKQPPSRSISNSLSASLPAEKLTKENHFKNCVPNHCRSTTAFVFPLQEN